MFLYHFGWTLAHILCMPIVAVARRGRLAERLAPKFPKDRLKEGNIWIHALSVGEVVSAVPLIERLSAKYPEKGVVLSVTTVKGMDIARKILEGSVNALFTMPVDSLWCVRRVVNYTRPAIFVLVETDIWPALPGYLKRRGIRSILVNGRVSPRTFRAYNRAPFFVRKMFDPLELCLMQSDLDRERLLSVGLNDEKVVTVGNIKFDRDWILMSEEELKGWFDLFGLGSESVLWVAGSTHQGEEEIILEVFKRLRPSFPHLRLIIAPRDIERSDEILRIIRGIGLKAVLRTGVSRDTAVYDVLVLNTIGELGRIYGLGIVSFVGGSLVPIGGHNLLEPASFGSPVLFGPHTHNFVSMSESLLEAGGGWRVQDINGLHDAVKMLMEDTRLRARMGALAKEFVQESRGALGRVVAHIARNMDQGAQGRIHEA